jgi:hypothetical protein
VRVPSPATPKSPLAARELVARADADVPPEPETPRPTPRFEPGRYVVTYDRRLGPVAVAPLTVIAYSAADLAEHIRRDLTPYLGQRIEITLDTHVSGGIIRTTEARGSFTYTRGGGAR